MGQSDILGSVIRVSIPQFKSIGIHSAVLGFESALAYHGLSNQDYYSQSILMTDKLKSGMTIYGVPVFVGVSSYPELEKTVYEDVMVVPWHIALCDVMERNEYSEDILQALYEIRNDEDKMSLLRQEAGKRKITELLEWELSEVDEYFNY